MGTQLMELKKTTSDKNGTRNNVMLVLVSCIIIIVSSYISEGRIGIPWLSLFALFFLEYNYLNRFLRKSLMKNGLCFDNIFIIEWTKIQSYKWVTPRKKKDFSYLNISYTSTIFPHAKVNLHVVDDQKEEVAKFFKKMVKTESPANNQKDSEKRNIGRTERMISKIAAISFRIFVVWIIWMIIYLVGRSFLLKLLY